MSMKVKELIEELKKVPQEMNVRIGTLTTDCGEVKRVITYEDEYVVELESDED